MSAAMVVVWVGTAVSLGAHQADLDGWAVARQLRIEEAAPDPLLPPAGHDDALADRIESLLSQARADAFSASSSGSGPALDAAQKLLEGAPELPESAFLMAEVHRQRALLVADADPALGRELLVRAVGLGGPRATPFTSAPAVPRPGQPAVVAPRSGVAVAAAPPPLGAPARLEGPLPDDEVEIDGVEVHDPPTLPDGAHHVRVLRSGRLAWAGWIAASGGDVRAPVPRVTACGATDLLAPRASSAAHSVECERYALARPAGPERIEVAVCHRSSCGEFLPWSRAWGATFEGPIHSPRPSPPRRSWILWTVVGVAAAAVTGVVLVEAGAFERRGPPHDSFEFLPPQPK